MALTDVSIRKAIPREDGKPLKLADSNGLCLPAMANGGKYWRLRYRWAGKEKMLALGVYPEVSLKEARERRDAARWLLYQNVDPGEKRRADRLASRIAAESSFKAVALEWHRSKAAEWAPNHAASVLATLETYLFPELGARPIAEIEPMGLLEVLRKVERSGKLDTAKQLRERCNGIFRLAVATARAKYNPAAELAPALQASIAKPMAALKLDELPGFMAALAVTDMTHHTRVLFLVVMVCLTRIGETVRAKREDFDLEAGVWVIPAENRKVKHKLKAVAPDHVVPLPRQVVAGLLSLTPLRGPGPYVFHNQHKPRAHMSESTPLKALERIGYGGKNKQHGNVVTHGFRATASTILNEAGFNPDAVERQLSHREPNKVRAAYNRAHYMEERRRMLQAWADYLEALGKEGRVIPWETGVATI